MTSRGEWHRSEVPNEGGGDVGATARQFSTAEECAQRGVEGLWSEYKRTGAQELRNQLIIYYSPFVKYVAGRVLAGLPRHFDEEDLISYGIIGLIDAIERFELDRNLRFETYAIPRIKGAIIDELRSIDWVPRSVRTKARAVEQAFTHL
jgi:RNA polymerase sigma factor FliA